MDIATRGERLVYNVESGVLSTFMSLENREYVHSRMLREVYDSTQGRVALSKQSDSELHALMTNIADPNKTLRELNRQAIATATDIILHNVSQYLHSMRDLENMAQPTLAPPENTRPTRSNGERIIY